MVSGPGERHAQRRREVEPRAVGDALDRLCGLEPFLGRVERQRGGVLRGAVPVVVRGFLFLQAAGVRQQDAQEIDRPSGRAHAAPEPVAHESR